MTLPMQPSSPWLPPTQVLNDVCTPPPHEAVHAPQSLHKVQAGHGSNKKGIRTLPLLIAIIVFV